MHISKIKLKNIKNFSDFKIDVSGDVLAICSENNGAGKSTIIGAISRILSIDHVPNSPIKNEELKGAETFETDKYAVTRSYSRKTIGGKISTKIEISTKGGIRAQNPSDILKNIKGAFIDPCQAMLLEEKKQLELYMKSSGVEFDIPQYEQDRAALFSERAGVNKRGKTDAAFLEKMERSEEIPEEVSIFKLLEKLEEQEKTAAEIKSIEDEEKHLCERILGIRQDEEEAQKVLAKIRENLYREESLQAKLREREIPDSPDITETRQTIASADEKNEKRNALVLQKEKRKNQESAVGTLRKESKALADKIELLDFQRNSAFAKAKTTIPGLAIDFKPNGKAAIFIKDTPLKDGRSTGEKICTWMDILMASAPELKTFLVDNAESLDASNLDKIKDKAKEHGWQVIFSFVGAKRDEKQILVLEG